MPPSSSPADHLLQSFHPQSTYSLVLRALVMVVPTDHQTKLTSKLAISSLQPSSQYVQNIVLKHEYKQCNASPTVHKMGVDSTVDVVDH